MSEHLSTIRFWESLWGSNVDKGGTGKNWMSTVDCTCFNIILMLAGFNLLSNPTRVYIFLSLALMCILNKWTVPKQNTDSRLIYRLWVLDGRES